MRQFMGKQPPSLIRPRGELIRSENNVMSHGVGTGIYVLCRLLSSRAGMHPYPGEVMAEALLHVLL